MFGGMAGGGKDIEETGKPVNNPNFDFFNYCGITRPVKLYTTPQTYLSDISLVSEVNGKAADISYEAVVSGKNGEKASCLVEVFDRSGVKVSESNGKKGTLHLDDVKLWEPLKSYLYTVKVTAGEDVYTLPYGVRTVRVEGKTVFHQ